jgi:hypothetical protein
MLRQFQRPDIPWLWQPARRAAGEPPNVRQVHTEQTYLADYNLLDIVFAQFGHAWRTEANRLCTGTPFGPVDFIPWDTPLERLRSYQVVLCFGRGVGIDRQTLDNLSAYVRRGGHLAVAAGQLRGEDDQFLGSELLGARLGATRLIEGMPQTAIEGPAGSEVLDTAHAAASPSLLRFAAGKGQVLLASGEWLSAVDEARLRPALVEMLASARWLRFAPESSWLEYAVQRKGESYVFALFDHGRGMFPSGNGVDHGAWEGTICMDLARLGLVARPLSVLRAVYRPEADVPFVLEAVPHTIDGSRLSLQLKLQPCQELIVGPREEAAEAFLR